MKILINGYYNGGNCPQFYNDLCNLGYQVLVFDPTWISSENPTFSPLYKQEDIIYSQHSITYHLALLFLRKFLRSFFKKFLIREAKEIVRLTNPDIIINHKIGLKANITLNTGFNHQYSFVYGSELSGASINSLEIKQSLKLSKIIYTTTNSTKDMLGKAYPEFASKMVNEYLGRSDIYDIQSYIQLNDKNELREKNNYSDQDILVFDNRTLRNLEITVQVLKAIKSTIEQIDLPVRFILIKGFLGIEDAVNYARKYITGNNLQNWIRIEDSIITDSKLYEYMLISDIFTSLLPKDQFGSCIIQASLFKNQIILRNLPQYKDFFGSERAFYINDIAEELPAIIRTIVNLDIKHARQILQENTHAIYETFDPMQRMQKIMSIIHTDLAQSEVK